MKGYKSKIVYNVAGKDGLVDTVNKMIHQGEDICSDRTHSIGMGAYCIVYVDKDADKDKSVLIKPDWEKAKSFKGQENAKQLLIDYAKEYMDVTEDAFDKRKGFDKLLATFQGKYGAAKRKENAALLDSQVYEETPEEGESEE